MGRIKKLPVRISVRTAKQCRFFFNFSSIFKGKKQQFDAIFSDFAIFETNFFRKFSSIFLVFCRYCWQDLVEFLPISKKEFKNSLIRFFFGRSKMSRVLSARARARARPSCSTGASGPFDDRRLRSTTFRARATFKK